MGETVLSIWSGRSQRDVARQRRGLLATVAMLAVSIGVFSVATSSPALAVTPDLTTPERVYTSISQEIDFTNVVDPISDDNRTIAVSVSPGPICDVDPAAGPIILNGCSRVQLDVSTNGSGLLSIPGSHTVTNANTNNVKTIVASTGAIIDQATDSDGGPSLVYHISGNENQLNDTLNLLKFVPTPGYETLAIQPTILHVVAINGQNGFNVSKNIEIKIEGVNGAPTINVPGAPVDAPVGTGQQNDPGTAFPADPSNPATPPLAKVVDPEMCNLTICGQSYNNPGGVEDDDAMLLIAWVDPMCGDFHFRGGAFPVHGGVLNSTVLALLTNVDTGQNPGLDLTGEQAAPILNALGLQAQTVDLQLQPSDVTSFTTAFAGVGSLDDVRYTLSQITYRGPTDDAACKLHLAVSDLGNSGMPAPHGYVGSPIGGADQPQPGYEIPDAKSDLQDITFNVKDTHPDVTIEQKNPGPAGDPTNMPAIFTAHFSEAMQSLTANDLNLSGLATVGNTTVTPAGSATDYDITVSPSVNNEGTITVSLDAGKVVASANPDAQHNNDASTSVDNVVTFDNNAPTATLAGSLAQVGSPVLMTVTFNEAINPAGFTGADVTLNSSTGDPLSAVVTPLTATSFQIAVTGMVNPGPSTITTSIAAGAVKDLAGNDSSVSNQLLIGWIGGAPADNTAPGVTIDQAGGQADPTSASPILFTAVFSEPVLGFTSSDVLVTGPAGSTATVSGAGPTYTVSVSGMSQSGAVSVTIPSGAATDLSLNGNTVSTSSDNTVTYNKPAAATTHFSVTAPASAQRNIAFNVTVTALDAGNATVSSYSGTVHFTSSDGAATVPANTTLVNGVGTFPVTLANLVDGNYTVTATDTVAAGITGTSGSIALSALPPAAATHLAVTSSASVTAGNILSVTVTALDSTNAATTNYSGTVHFTSSDGAAILPADSTLLNGTKVFSVTLKTAGNRVLTATDTVAPLIKGVVAGGVTVLPAAATHFSTSAPASVASAAPFSLTVTAKDAFNNTATTYAGTVHLTSSDGAAVLPANSTLVSGTKVFSITLATAGSKTVTATDTVTPSITGFSNVSVSAPAAATHFAVTTVGSTTAGSAISVTVAALTASNAPATTYAGTVHLTSSDGQAVLPANSTLVNGTKVFSVTLQTAGNMTVTAADTVTASINGTSGTISVAPSVATHLTVAVPPVSTVLAPFTAVVTAFDAFNNIATGYLGSVHITSSGAALLPGDSGLPSGVGLFSIILTAAGPATVTATDGGITATSPPTTAGLAAQPAATSFALSVPPTASAGVSFNVTVTAMAGITPTSNYSGTLTFTSPSTGTLPASVALINGVGVYPVTLNQAGSRTVTATDTVSPAITGTSASIAISAGAATHFTVSAPASAVLNIPVSVVVSALDANNNQATGYGGTVHFTSSDPAAALPLDAGLAGGVGTFQATLKTAGIRTITGTDTVTPSITGTTNPITVAVPAPATHFAVTSNATSAAGSTLSVTVTALDAGNLATTNYVGSVTFSSSDGAAVLPPNLVLINGVGVVSVTLKTAGVQTITATDTVTPSKNGVTGNITVTPGAATHLSVSAPANASNGFTVSILVTAKDQFNNTATGYAGTVHLTSTDGAASLGANSTLTGGTKVYSASFTTNGSQTVTATDTVSAAINGTSGTIAVSGLPPTPATHFSVSAAGSSTAGNAVSVTVTALDAANAATAGYSGTVHITSPDGAAILPANSTLLNGVGIFPVTLSTAGNQTVTATDTLTPSITGVSGVIVVAAAAATHLGVVAPSAATSGAPVSLVVTALDQFGNRDTGYPGSVHVTSSDVAAVLPANNTLVNGIGTFPITLNTLGSSTVTATDSVNNAIAGTSAAIGVTNAPPGAATHFAVSAPSSASAGSAFSVTVTALSAANSTASGYSGIVHFTSTSAGTLPADVALVNGVGVVSVTLTASGGQTVTATDTASAITGTSGAIDVAAAAVAQLQISVPIFVQVTAFNSVTRQIEVVGSQWSFTVKALDQYGNVATSYAGIVHFLSDDPTAVLPPDSPLVNGVGTFTVVFHRAGTNSVSAVDAANPGVAGATSGGVVVTSKGTPGVPDPGTLPATGSNSIPALWIAFLMIIAGIGALAMRSRRRRGTPR